MGFVWLWKTKIWWKRKTLLYGYKYCYMDINSFIVYIKADDIYKSNGEDDETRFDTSNYELHSTLPKGKNKKVFGLMKDESDEKIERKFVALRANSYSYLKDGGSEDKKAK